MRGPSSNLWLAGNLLGLVSSCGPDAGEPLQASNEDASIAADAGDASTPTVDAGKELDGGVCAAIEVFPEHVTMGPERMRSIVIVNRGSHTSSVFVRRTEEPVGLMTSPRVPGTFHIEPRGQLEIRLDASALAPPWEGIMSVHYGCFDADIDVDVPIRGQ
jgi:hypothetical protein